MQKCWIIFLLFFEFQEAERDRETIGKGESRFYKF